MTSGKKNRAVAAAEAPANATSAPQPIHKKSRRLTAAATGFGAGEAVGAAGGGGVVIVVGADEFNNSYVIMSNVSKIRAR